MIYRFRKEKKVFFDQEKDKDVSSKDFGWNEVSCEEEEYEYEDIDPQF